MESEFLLNGIWLGTMMVFFYIAFIAYVTPYLALLPELGHNNSLRINLSTMIAFFGLLGMVLITVIFPAVVGYLQDSGAGLSAFFLPGSCFTVCSFRRGAALSGSSRFQ
ncbi:MAG: MFS transporter [Bacillota bacterium]|nr:MFS transporter [Bacillota bacterium]